MQKQDNIAEKFCAGKTVFSVEFFPPKTEEGARQMLRTADRLRGLLPDYVSITYGAGGSSRERTVEYGGILRNVFGFNVMPHLTCVGHSKLEISEMLKKYSESGFKNIMALRGDPPKDSPEFVPNPDGFKHASELIEFVKSNFPDFSIGCAAYPEKHPEATSLDADIDNLQKKIDAGADFMITQMFFNNSHFFNFRQKCRKRGISKPIIAGILPALSYKQALNFRKMSSSEIPDELLRQLSAAEDDADAALIGLEWAERQLEELLAENVDGIHLYILNRAESALKLSRLLRGRYS